MMSSFKGFRWVAFMEGLSFVLLLFIAMPMKYVWGMPQAVRVIGMAHGALFVAYVVLAFDVGSDLKWSRRRILGALLASLVPFGTFYFDYKYLRTAEAA